MLKFLFSASSDPVLSFDTNHRLVQANAAALQWLGYTLDELIGQPVTSIITDVKILSLGETFESIAVRCKDGSIKSTQGAAHRHDREGMLLILRPLEVQAEAIEMASLIREDPNPIIRIRRDGAVLFSNQSGKMLLEMLGQANGQSVPADWVREAARVLASGQQTDVIQKIGESIFSLLFMPVQTMRYVNVFALDISAREAARADDDLSKLILNAISNMVLVSDQNAEIIYISPSVKNILGYNIYEVIGDGWWNIERSSGGDVDAEKTYVRNAATGRQIVDNTPYEHRVRHKDGSWRWLMLADARGPRDTLIGIGTDITDLKLAQVELQRQRDFAVTVMEQVGQGLTVTDTNGKFLFVNRAYAQMLGYKPEELIGRRPPEFTTPEGITVLEKAVAECQEGKTTRYEIPLVHRQGHQLWAMLTGAPRFPEDGKYNGAITIATDMTERRQIEKMITDARDRAIEASQLKSAFLATMSHEIRTPMNSIIGMTELLLDTALDEDQREFAGVVNTAGQALLAIINDILDFSKIEAGKFIILSNPFHVHKLVNDVIELLRPKIDEKGLEIQVNIDPNIPDKLISDGGRIRQVLLNLANNAVKFTEAGSIQISVEKAAPHFSNEADVSDAEFVRFTIKDTGIGIPEKTQPLLFEPFIQGDASATRRFGGAGLGLAISRRLVELLDGKIGFTSAEGKGSTFWFVLPLGRTAPHRHTAGLPAITKKLSMLQSASQSQLHKPVLIVEDTTSNRQLLALQLREMGFESYAVENGMQAVELLTTRPEDFSLALMDLNLPDMDGLTATSVIRQNEITTGKHAIIIAITANAVLGEHERCIKAGMDDFITKPATMKSIKDVLDAWLNTG